MLHIFMPDRGGSSVLQRLKFATKSLHAKLDKSLTIAQPHAGITQYLDHLRLTNLWLNELNARFIFRREYAIQKAYSLNNCLLDLIYNDFKFSDTPHYFREGYPETEFRPPISLPFFWGITYVINGSALGANHLFKVLSKKIPEHPLHYFHEASMQGMDRWADFSLNIEKNIKNELDFTCAEKGAIWAFEQIIDLSQLSPSTQKI
jgi:heme oxygenase